MPIDNDIDIIVHIVIFGSLPGNDEQQRRGSQIQNSKHSINRLSEKIQQQQMNKPVVLVARCWRFKLVKSKEEKDGRSQECLIYLGGWPCQGWEI